MLRAETIHPKELSASDAAAWRALCAGRAAYASPLLGPDFAQGVGAVGGERTRKRLSGGGGLEGGRFLALETGDFEMFGRVFGEITDWAAQKKTIV